MKCVKYSNIKPEEIVFYHTTENNMHGIHVQLGKLEYPSVLVYAYGGYHDEYFQWQWDSKKIMQPETEATHFREEVINVNQGEIKGHILLNNDGNIIETNFSPTILAINLRIEGISENGSVFSVDKEKIGEIDKLPSYTKNVEFYQFGDIKVKNRIKQFLRNKSQVNETIKIMDPYLTPDLFKLLKVVIPGDLKIEILTTKVNNLTSLMNELKSFPIEVNIVIKQLIEQGNPIEITERITPNPFHDRCIISDRDLLIIGTSFNSIIKNSIFLTETINNSIVQNKFDEWFSGKTFLYQGKSLKFEQFYP